MGVETSVNVGWYAILNDGTSCHKMTEILSEKYNKPEWNGFIWGTDPMCGTNNHYCIFQSKKYSTDIDLYDHTVLSFTTKSFMPQGVPAEIQEFVDAYRDEFGDDSIKVDFGLIAYAH